MKKLLLFLAALCATAWGQVDIPITQNGPYKTIAQSWTWAGVGVGGVNNNYTFTPLSTNEGLCLYVGNENATQHTYAVQFFATGNPAISAFTGNTGNWTLIGPSNGTVTLNAASATKAYFVQ